MTGWLPSFLLFLNTYYNIRSEMHQFFINLIDWLFFVENQICKFFSIMNKDKSVVFMIVAEFVFRAFAYPRECSVDVFIRNKVFCTKIAVVEA